MTATATNAKKATKKKVPLEERQKEILEAAQKVFMECGYGGASMRAIAARAGVNEAMLYRVCSSKEQLFEKSVAGALEKVVENAISRSFAILAKGPGALDIRGIIRHFITDLLCAMRDIAPLLNAVLLSDKESAADFYRTRFEPLLNRVIQAVNDNKDVWAYPDSDGELPVRAVFGMCWYFAIHERFSGSGTDNLEHKAEQITNLICDGVNLRVDND